MLVEGDDINEPVSDAIRGVLDGHVRLSRSLANRGHWPAVCVLESIRRLMVDVVDEAHLEAAKAVRRVLALWADIEDLVNLGAYAKGSNDSGFQNRLMEEASDSSKPGKVVSAAKRSGSSPSSQEAMFERIARAVDARIGKGESVARILLDPPSLGHVRVEVRMRKDQVQLRLVTETAEARRVLTSRIGELRAALEREGLHVQRMEFVATPGFASGEEGSGMSLTSAMLTGLTGIKSNQFSVETIGQNVANVNTTAFKSSRATFETLFVRTLAGGTAPSET